MKRDFVNRPKLSNVIKLVRKEACQRENEFQKEKKELSERKIDSKTGRRGLRLKKRYEEGFSVQRRSRGRCGYP